MGAFGEFSDPHETLLVFVFNQYRLQTLLSSSSSAAGSVSSSRPELGAPVSTRERAGVVTLRETIPVWD